MRQFTGNTLVRRLPSLAFLRAGRSPRAFRRSRMVAFHGLLIGLACMGLQALAQNIGSQVDCSSSLFSSSPACASNQLSTAQQAISVPAPPVSDSGSSLLPQRNPDSQQVYTDQAGLTQRRASTSDQRIDLFPPDPITDFQRLARVSTGTLLPIFGRDLFQHAPSTFAPADQIPVTADYVVGPGDEILLRLWGPETLNSQLTVDTAGSIYIPKVGAIHVAGLRFDQLQKDISTQVNQIYRNYKISVSLGHLRSIQVYVVGEARRPGAYTISSLSTVLNALFASGGPNVQGSLRHIQVRRAGVTLPDFDLYDLVLHGDQSKDVRLQGGDTIFIPPVGQLAALAGSVRHPAIYELKDRTTVEDLLNLAGGFSSIGVPTELRLERIEGDRTRQAMIIALNATGRDTILHDGDVLYTEHITDAYQKSVTIRGNLANPGRFAWHEGMRLSDIIPDRKSLLTNDYWREINSLGVPVPLFQPLNPPNPQGQETPAAPGAPGGAATSTQGYADAGGNGAASSRTGAVSLAVPLATSVPGEDIRPDIKNRIQIPAPEIDWSYAVIERLDPITLKSTLVPFNLGRLVENHDPSQNLLLQPGDIVTILSQNDISVPTDERTKYVRLEGEFASAGVYSVAPGETLEELVQRAGGFTPKAYLYGSSFTRESARAFQQQRLDEYISSLSADMERSAAVRAASSVSGILDPNSLNEQRGLVAQLRTMRATGRVVLEFKPDTTGTASVPSIPLENGDVFRVPSRPNTVSVLGAVYGQNVYLYDSNRRLRDYITLAGGPNRVADRKHAFVIRADGSIFSRDHAQGTFSHHFDSAIINPGDSVVVPEKLIKPSSIRTLLDYSQILSSFGLAAAAINVVR
jgi:polysaccharide export outer membrane protein